MVAVQICIPNNAGGRVVKNLPANAGGSQIWFLVWEESRGSLFSTFSPVFISNLLMMAVLIAVRCCLNVILICIPFMTGLLEHLLLCLWAICLSSLERCQFESSAHYFIKWWWWWWWWWYILLNYMSSWYILDINHLSDIHFANVFFHLWVVAQCFDL